MTQRVLFLLGLALAACGDSSDSSDGDELASAGRLTAERVAAVGEYCCYQNGEATVDSPEVCDAGAKDCIWSETSSDVDASGRGTMCGYLACE
jgi:hypothetical protein